MPDLVVFDPVFDGLVADTELLAMLVRHGFNRRYDSVWQERPEVQAADCV